MHHRGLPSRRTLPTLAVSSGRRSSTQDCRAYYTSQQQCGGNSVQATDRSTVWAGPGLVRRSHLALSEFEPSQGDNADTHRPLPGGIRTVLGMYTLPAHEMPLVACFVCAVNEFCVEQLPRGSLHFNSTVIELERAAHQTVAEVLLHTRAIRRHVLAVSGSSRMAGG